MPTLHYVFDPLCGWCYAASPLIEAARTVPGLHIELHAGGMMTGSNRRTITPRWREYVMPHDQRIASLSGQAFGQAYFEGLLRDTEAIMDSEPPITAVLAAQSLTGRGLDMLHRQQHAHYVEGRRIAEPAVLHALAEDLGLDPIAFAETYLTHEGVTTQTHIAAARDWLARVGAQGFPTLILEDDEGRISVLDHSRYLGQADAWRSALQATLPPPENAPSAAQCGPDACII
jgi:putative protein-disulfide isomerase